MEIGEEITSHHRREENLEHGQMNGHQIQNNRPYTNVNTNVGILILKEKKMWSIDK